MGGLILGLPDWKAFMSEPQTAQASTLTRSSSSLHDGIGTLYGCKTMNTHIHLLEALTGLYRVWPDRQLEARLRELFMIVRDKIAVRVEQVNEHRIILRRRTFRFPVQCDRPRFAGAGEIVTQEGDERGLAQFGGERIFDRAGICVWGKDQIGVKRKTLRRF